METSSNNSQTPVEVVYYIHLSLTLSFSLLPSLPPSLSLLLPLQSSIGDVKTLRSQLHARRTTLNEEIGKEDHILQGSKKLVGASLDHKTKDQASLEMSFAESKIKALQAELAKINSSLHAYQDERFVLSQATFTFAS